MSRHHRFQTGFGFVSRLLVLSAALLPIVGAQPAAAQRLWYRQPASKWTEALPLGNGRLGAMLFGGVSDERLQLNEDTLWGGGPHDYADPASAALLPKIRELIFAGHPEQAEKIAQGFLGKPSTLMPYMAFCDLRLHFNGVDQPEDYRRELRLDQAVAKVEFRSHGVQFKREVFVSYPDNVVVVRLAASKPGALNFTVALDSPQPGAKVEATGDDSLLVSGQVQPRNNPKYSWTGSWDQPGLHYAGRLLVHTRGGTSKREGDSLRVANASSVTLLFSGATSFVNYRQIDGHPLEATSETLRRAGGKSFDQLLRRHLADYQPLFSRVSLKLGDAASGEAADEKPTDERLRDVKNGGDPSLYALYYQFGRYAMLASSRGGGQPANLQGIWNDSLLPAWGSKWTTNINLEMNYWIAESGGLPEAEQPLWNLIRDLEVSGGDTAQRMYGAHGWVLHHNTDLWRATAPVDGPWGIWPMGEAWLANQMWTHYEFTGDRAFLRAEAWPAIRGAAEFVLDTMVKAPEGTAAAGKLVTVPSTSPENEYLINGQRVHLTYAPTMDIELVGELLHHVEQASSILGVDRDLAARAAAAAAQLPPLRVGPQGQLEEWIENFSETDPQHRHVSHLYALFPGEDIDLDKTPRLAAAARRSLEIRGDQSTGWAEAWRAALWARLRDGDHAFKLLQTLLATNTLPNMFDVCPPFQIDGNFGGPTAMAEMLVQSQNGVLRLLPALPAAWPDGELRGLRARHGLTVDVTWRNGQLISARVRAAFPGAYHVVYGTHSIDLHLKAGQTQELNGELSFSGKRQRP